MTANHVAEFAALPVEQQRRLLDIARTAAGMDGPQVALAGTIFDVTMRHLASMTEGSEDFAESFPAQHLCTVLVGLLFADVLDVEAVAS